MSRNIAPKSSLSMTKDEISLRKTENGKLLFTAYQGRNCSMLLQNDRLVSVSFFNDNTSKVGAIYIGKIKNIAKNIDACFVEIANGEICFLPLQRVTSPYLMNRIYDGRLLQGDELLVQVERDAQKTKQASVTTQISLANEYFSFTLGDNKTAMRYSSKLSPAQKENIRNIFITQAASIQTHFSNMVSSQYNVGKFWVQETPEQLFSILSRTKAGECESAEALLTPFWALAEELLNLLNLSSYRSCFSCIKEAPRAYESILSRLDTTDYQEIITDNASLYQELLLYCQKHDFNKNIRLYQDTTLSLSAVYSLSSKMDMALERRIWLKSGGYLIIEPTEALTVIDVNTGKYEAKKGAEETFFKINLEAAEEIALQLKLRNLSGIIIVDFINMHSRQNKTELLNYLKSLVAKDKILTTVVDMTPLGLVEITRRKILPTLQEQYKNTGININSKH